MFSVFGIFGIIYFKHLSYPLVTRHHLTSRRDVQVMLEDLSVIDVSKLSVRCLINSTKYEKKKALRKVGKKSSRKDFYHRMLYFVGKISCK